MSAGKSDWDKKLQTTPVAEQEEPLLTSASPSGVSFGRSGASPAQVVKHQDVGIHIVYIVGIGWVLCRSPLLWLWTFSGEHVSAVLGFIIHAVKASDLLGKITKEAASQSSSHHHGQVSCLTLPHCSLPYLGCSPHPCPTQEQSQEQDCRPHEPPGSISGLKESLNQTVYPGVKGTAFLTVPQQPRVTDPSLSALVDSHPLPRKWQNSHNPTDDIF